MSDRVRIEKKLKKKWKRNDIELKKKWKRVQIEKGKIALIEIGKSKLAEEKKIKKN